MSIPLKQSTAYTWKAGPFLNSTDGKTPETALSIAQADIRLSKNGGDFAQSHNSAGGTHDEMGEYDIPLDSTDTGTLGIMKAEIQKTGALPVWDWFEVLPPNVYDSLYGDDNLQVDLKQILGSTLTETAGQIAAAFKKFFDVATPVATAESVNQSGDNYPKVEMMPTIWFSP